MPANQQSNDDESENEQPFTNEEICAIIAHELGHHKNNDNFKLLVMSTVKLGIMFFLYSVVLNNEGILISFGFDHRSNFVSLMLFFKLYESLGFIMNKMTNQYIRKIEYQAD